MTDLEIKTNVQEICAKIFQVTNMNGALLECQDFVDDLGMDSITFITLVVDIETCFNITIPDDLLLIDNFRSLDEVTKIIAAQLAVL